MYSINENQQSMDCVMDCSMDFGLCYGLVQLFNLPLSFAFVGAPFQNGVLKLTAPSMSAHICTI